MKRFSSIDFLRGTAIFIMIALHTISWFLNAQTILDDINNAPLINILALVVLEFLGGLAGFFLLVSAIGNMISMYKRLQSGRSADDLIRNQVITGILLIIFAYLVEGTTGYLGALGDFFHNLNNPGGPNYLGTMFSRFAHFETIHTIAWCLLINGIVQYFLSRNDRWKNIGFQIKVYAVLAIVVVAITQPVWWLVETYGAQGGYPWNLTTGAFIAEPYIFGPDATFLTVLKSVFLNAIASTEEPILPYLAVSFIGSIIGIVISQPREQVPLNFPRKILFLGLAMFLVGIVGVITFIVTIITGPASDPFGAAVSAYQKISYHRDYWDNPAVTETFTFPLAWLWQFLALNGVGIMMTMLVIRLVEFRGIGAQFAQKSTFIRRFGFTAFTNYNNQWYLWILQFLFAVVVVNMGLEGLVGARDIPYAWYPYSPVNWPSVGILLLCVYGFYYLILRLWEKIGYVGTLEWCIGTIGAYLKPSKKGTANAAKKWWQKGQLDVQNAFYNAEWEDIVTKDEIKHDVLAESKFAYKLALISLVSIVFIPATFVAWSLAVTAQRTEGKNKFNQVAKVVAIIGSCLFIGVLVALFVLTPNMLGLAL
jgi:hypothetical protein